MSYTNTRSTSRKRIPDDGTPFPLGDLQPRLSATTEQHSTQDECPQLPVLPFRPRSIVQASVCSQADTVYGSEHWSVSTFADLELDTTYGSEHWSAGTLTSPEPKTTFGSEYWSASTLTDPELETTYGSEHWSGSTLTDPRLEKLYGSEHWSASTLIDPELEPHQVNQQIEYLVQASEPCSHRSPAAKSAQPVPLSLANLKIAHVSIRCAMDQFLTEDPSETPPTAFNFRVSAALPVLG
jgi:hypothetical protein